MKIVREQREENNSLLRVTVGEEDYGQAVEQELRESKRKANIPGFRPGMVPMGLVKKMYGKGVLAEQSYRTASNAVFEYLQKEKIDYLGDVICGGAGRFRCRKRQGVRFRVRDRRGSRDQTRSFGQG